MKRIVQTIAAASVVLVSAGAWAAADGCGIAAKAAAIKAALAREAQEGEKKPRRIPNVEPTTWKRLQQAEELVKVEQYAEAVEILTGMLPREGRRSRYNPAELGQIHNMLGFIYWELEQPAKTIDHYRKVLEQVPSIAEATEALTLHQLAKLYFMQAQEQSEDSEELARRWYNQSLDTMGEWLEKGRDTGPDPYFFIAQIYYQLKDFVCGIESLETTIAIAREEGMKPKEPWWRMLQFMYFDQQNWPKVIEILEILVREYPKREYWVTLASAYGEVGDEQKQLLVFEAAHVGGYLDKETDLKSYGALLLQAEVPNRASKYLRQAFDAGLIERTPKNLQLGGQAEQVAQNVDDAIEYFEESAAIEEDGKTFDLLTSLYLDKDRFAECRTAARQALDAGGLSNPLRTMINMATCEFYLDNLSDARKTFVGVRREAREQRERRFETMASDWIKYIDSETERREELRKAGL